MAKQKAPGIAAIKTAKDANIIVGGFRPVDENGETPALWAHCVGYELDDPTATVDTQDLLEAIQAGEKSKKLKDSDKRDKSKLETALTVEKKKAKDDREKGPKVTPDKVKVDDPLKKGR
jgi:hypothetical protein